MKVTSKTELVSSERRQPWNPRHVAQDLLSNVNYCCSSKEFKRIADLILEAYDNECTIHTERNMNSAYTHVKIEHRYYAYKCAVLIG